MASLKRAGVRAGGIFALLLLLTLFLPTLANAAPRILALYPTGGQRGTTVTVTIQGEGLKDLNGFFTLGNGLGATMLPGTGKDPDNGLRTAELTIAPDATQGIQQIRFYDGTGLSNPRYFRIGTFPEIAEKEPNNQTAQAMRLPSLPVTVNARVAENPDRDGFVFSGKAGETVVCEVEGLRVLGQVGDSWLKGYLEIQDASGKVLMSSQGTVDDYYRWDPMLAFAVPKDGDYYVFFRDLNWRGDVRAVYRLSVSVTPHATGVFPLGGKRGTTVPVTAVGPNCIPTPTSISVPMDAPGSLEIGPGGVNNLRPFQVSDLPDVLQMAGNQKREAAQVVAFGAVVNGRLTPNVSDFYKFKLDAPQKILLEVFSRRLGTPVDSEILLYDANGGVMQGDDDGRGADSWIIRDLPAGEFTVAVRDVQDRGGPEWGYRLVIAPPRPELTLIVTPDNPKLARGGTVELSVQAGREYGWDADITVTLENPPSGVTASPLTIPKGKGDGKLTVTAAADASLGPIRLRFTGASTIGETKVRALAITRETYNIQGTAFLRDLIGPILLITEK